MGTKRGGFGFGLVRLIIFSWLRFVWILDFFRIKVIDFIGQQ